MFISVFVEIFVFGIPKATQKSGIRQEDAQDLSQAKPSPKQHNLNKLCDADGLI
jgi:hypothetical protein